MSTTERDPSVDSAPSGSYSLNVGDRIEFKRARGFVRYVGELRDKSGVWVGVDWDDVTRGRHDGSLGGISYFAATGPKSGSFVRAAKLAHGGRQTLADAIRARLSAERDSVTLDNTIELGNAPVSIHFRAAPEPE
eukprot:IDg13685t1